MVKNKIGKPFLLYRYQILPITRSPQLNLFGEKLTIEQLIAKKNEYFEATLQDVKNFSRERTPIIARELGKRDNLFVIQIGANRPIKRSKSDFTKESVDNWPPIRIIIENSSNTQLAAIEKNSSAFQNPSTPLTILEENINQRLKRYNLRAIFEPVSRVKDFWRIVKENEGEITKATFELITPNMSNISKSLSQDLKLLALTTNTQTTGLELDSDKDSTLSLSKENQSLASLVEYVSEGGGKAKLKVKGMSGEICTADSIVEFRIDEAEFENINLDQLLGLLTSAKNG